jgi:hypothetical protein
MRPVAFSMQFRGFSMHLSPGVLTARATAPSSAFVTRIAEDGVHGSFDLVDGDEAHLECRLTFLDYTRFDEVGTISFGNGNALRFRSIGEGTIAPSSDPHLRQGTAAWDIDGGAGVFADASGRIVSNFLLSDTGDLTDHQLGVVFLCEETGADAMTDRREAL